MAVRLRNAWTDGMYVPMMVRFAIVATFLTVTLGAWVVMKPPSSGVERLANGTILGRDDDPAGVVEVTRARSADPVLPTAMSMPSDTQLLRSTLDAILDRLGFAADQATTVAQQAEPPLPMVDIIVAGIEARTPDAEIAAEIDAGFATADLAVPAALITTEGRVDTTTLLAAVVTGAKQRLGEAAPQPGVDQVGYTVAEGDSLAAIAVQIYGDIHAWTALWEANAALLPSPARIEAGMQLRVPPI